MTKEKIFDVVKKNVLEILPDLSPELITIDGRLKDLGANSIDRMEIVTQTLEDLELVIPLVELGGVGNLRELVDLLDAKKHE